MSGIDAINGIGQQFYSYNNSLGKGDFLKLLICQLKQQDPLEPVKNTEFLAQMSQLTSLETLQDLNKKMEQLIALQQLAWEQQEIAHSANLLGRVVEAVNPEDGKVITGKVLGFYQNKGIIYLQLENKAVPIYWVNKVSVASQEGKDQ
ncbi:MAG TPA: hypothetical protein GX502_05825 [Syntrophaceticus sp.]|nr:hypothetical protein [Syntrophaceticus sp.]